MNTLCWLRRDLRLHDHAALSQALVEGHCLLLFVFDSHILSKLKEKSDKRVTFIMDSLKELEKKLQKKGSTLLIVYGKPEEEVPKICEQYQIQKVFTNRDYEPYAKARDAKVAKNLKANQIEFQTFKDSVFFEKHEVLTGQGGVYKVFTPYKNKWLQKFNHGGQNVSDYGCSFKNLRKINFEQNILNYDWYKEIGFIEDRPVIQAGSSHGLKRLKKFQSQIDDYKLKRDFPALDGTSQLSVYLRFGNISLRDMIRAALLEQSEGAKTWLTEIIWRDFYQTILDAFPHVEHAPFKSEYANIKWHGSEKHFKAWREGKTGFPIIDGAMRCLNETGMMHNRLRMIVASFLCKTLLINWQKGEQYFARKLLDFDLAANSGGWQWSASTGCDAQPYFRIFNPYTQAKKFDPDQVFIHRWIPEFGSTNYPAPIVSYEINRARCLEMYSAALQSI